MRQLSITILEYLLTNLTEEVIFPCTSLIHKSEHICITTIQGPTKLFTVTVMCDVIEVVWISINPCTINP
jgi:hypothetical protein